MPAVAGVGGTTLKISGVPSMDVAETLNSTFTVTNAISFFYNDTRIARVEGVEITNVDVALPGTAPISGSNFIVTNQSAILLTNVYSEDITLSFLGYNSVDTIGNATQASSVRIDTVSDETIRVTSGVGQYPVIGVGNVGDAFDSTISLLTASNEELQLLNEQGYE